eukprot:9195-Rhodomonas_salina.4
MSGTETGYAATRGTAQRRMGGKRSPLSAYAHAMSSTDLAKGVLCPRGRRCCLAMPGTTLRSSAVPGTELGYAATS